ncbi:hypothetical protein HMPREF0658_0037 [Hoylesella marshii DSM 16973 = JCM 13450]|uniref:Uncharacterized protein n=1 Tax=Hoylesella marshii DSM 16973 = JCM 13450 TaxID=862515 RepID=E0NPD6_9BACT|nr:hypothetical protein HMPREF0658_0037 [Hoylesella marshii DSM 16973 = JCM 13450]
MPYARFQVEKKADGDTKIDRAIYKRGRLLADPVSFRVADEQMFPV